MKVLHVIPSLSAVHGGPSHALAMIERALSAQGVSVETCTTDDDGPGRRNGKPGGVPLAENGAIRRYFRKQSEFYKFSAPLAMWLGRHAKDYDVVHIHALFSFTSVVAAWAARRARVPYVLRPLGTLSRYGMDTRRPWLKRLSLRWIEGPLLARSAAVHFTSHQEQVEASGMGIQFEGKVIPLAAELAQSQDSGALLERHPELRGAQCLLFLSRLDPKKNIESLLEATALCRKSLPGLMLLVAGDGRASYVSKLKSRATALGLERQIVWAGRLDGELKAAAFELAQAFVLPSFSENFGIAAAEALTAGVPCILGEGVALAAEAASAGAGLSVAPTASAIAEGIAQVMSDPRRQASMRAAALDFAGRSLSAQRMGARLVAMYSDILSRP